MAPGFWGSPAVQANLRRLLRPRDVAVLGGVDAQTVAGVSAGASAMTVHSGQLQPKALKSIGGFACFKSG